MKWPPQPIGRVHGAMQGIAIPEDGFAGFQFNNFVAGQTFVEAFLGRFNFFRRAIATVAARNQ